MLVHGVNILADISESQGSYLVPAELTKGRAKHWRPPAQGKVTNLPFAHCANAPLMQAFSPLVHDEDADRVWNLRFNA